ncbi:MAG: PEP-utilizing enzyme [Candidatus Woesearchaeota archaeon]
MESNYTFLWNDYQPHRTIEGNIIPLKQFRDTIWNQLNNIIQVSRHNHIYCFHSTEDLKNDIERGKNFFDKEYAAKFLAEINEISREVWEGFHLLDNTDFSKLSNQELFEIYKKFVIVRWGKIISYFRATQAEGTHYLVEELKKKFSDEDVTILMSPIELDLANKEVLDWQEIVKQPYSKEPLLAHARKHPWAVMDHFSFDEVIETLTQRYNFDVKNPMTFNFIEEKKKLKEKQENLLKNNEDKRWLVELIQKLALSRMTVKSCWAGSDFYVIKLIEEVAKRSNENPNDIHKYHLMGEIRNLLEGKPLSDEEKQKRDKCFVGLWKNGKETYVSGDEAERLAEKELQELYQIGDKNELNGMVAHPGVVKGIARILPCNNVEKTRELRQTFNKGEILFTGMTQPQIMDIASKAGAIVTDEGGMLSHAATISREFKIPCIVGTHYGTQVFKDGDIVEVDANKGIVRKINK